tara:strand:+ start:4137 stop:4379 length:243 start_codon:yes stop_codon:yes gene_type:complete
MKELACGSCPNLKVKDIAFGCFSIYCSKLNSEVPQAICNEEKTVTFYRIPLSCPRSNIDVVKSESKAKIEDWVTRRFSDL